MSVSATPKSAEERSSVIVPGSTEVSRSTDRRYSEVVNEYMKKQNRLGSDSSVQPSQVLTQQADEAGPTGTSYVNWDHPDTPSSQRAGSSHGSYVEDQSPQRTSRSPSAVDEADTKELQYLNPEVCSRDARGGSASSNMSGRTANDSYVTARTHYSPQMETFSSPFSQSSSTNSLNTHGTSTSSPKMGRKACKTPPQPPPKPSPKEEANLRTSPTPSPRSDKNAPWTAQHLTPQASRSSNPHLGSPNPFRGDLQSPGPQQPPPPGGSGQNHRSPGKAPAIKVISVGGSPRHLLREGQGEESCLEPARDKPLSPEDLSTWLTTASPEGGRGSKGDQGGPSGTTPLVPLTSNQQDPYRTHLVPNKTTRDSQEGRQESQAPKATAEDISVSDGKRCSYSGETSMYYSPQDVQPFNPRALNFEIVSGRGSDVSESFRDALGSVSYPPDETGVRRYTFVSPPKTPSSGGGISLPQMLWSPWGRRPGFLDHLTPYEKSLDKQERLGWCLVVTGVLLLIASAITILVVEVPAHRGGLLLDEPVSQPLRDLLQDDLGSKFILTPAEASDVTTVSDPEDSTLSPRDSTSGTDGETLISKPPTSGIEASNPISGSSTPGSQGFVPNMADVTSKPDGPIITESSGSEGLVTVQEAFLDDKSSTIATTKSSTPDDVQVPTIKGSISDPEDSIIPKRATLEPRESVIAIDGSIPDPEEESTQEFDGPVVPSVSSKSDSKDSFSAIEGATPGSEVPIVTTEGSPRDPKDSLTPNESSGDVNGSLKESKAPLPDLTGAEDSTFRPASSPPVPLVLTTSTESVTQELEPVVSSAIGTSTTAQFKNFLNSTDTPAVLTNNVSSTDSATAATDSAAPATESPSPSGDSGGLPRESGALSTDSSTEPWELGPPTPPAESNLRTEGPPISSQSVGPLAPLDLNSSEHISPVEILSILNEMAQGNALHNSTSPYPASLVASSAEAGQGSSSSSSASTKHLEMMDGRPEYLEPNRTSNE